VGSTHNQVIIDETCFSTALSGTSYPMSASLWSGNVYRELYGFLKRGNLSMMLLKQRARTRNDLGYGSEAI